MRQALVVTLALFALAFAGCGDSGAAGTYTMDVDAFMEAMMKQLGPMFEAMPEDAREKAKQEMRENIKGGVTMTLNSDSTFTGTASMEGDPETINGTWKLEGENLTLTRTYAEGEEKDGPDVMTGTLKGGEIRLKFEEDMPFEVVLRKD